MTQDLTETAREEFAAHFGCEAQGVVFAPGRVNLIGEHVDYNEGLVLPMPVKAGTAIAWSTEEGAEIKVHAADLAESDSFPADAPSKPEQVGWTSYVRGMAAQRDTPLPAMRLLITGDLPRGSGLSSSASLCIALGRAFDAATGGWTDPTVLAKKAQKTEHEFAGVACGIMDQMAVAAGEPGHAMQLDCRDLAYRQVAMPDDWAVLVVNSGVTRGLVDGEYNARRAQCEAAAAALGVASLRDATMDEMASADLPELEARRASHVVSEIARVRQASNALEQGDLAGFGQVLREGHASLRDLFEVSHPVVDQLVDRLQEIVGKDGGARMTGAGFGGSVVVVTSPGNVAAIEAEFGDRLLRVT